MKKIISLLSFFFLLFIITVKSAGQVTNPGAVVQTDASAQANSNINNSVNNGLSSVANGVTGLFKKKNKPVVADSTQQSQAATSTGQATPANQNGAAAQNGQSSQQPVGSLASYQNYDFVPGNTVIFEDEFTDDDAGEFPAHWNLDGGQAVLNMAGADKAFFMTDGNYCRVSPLMKNKAYLTNSFSVELDYYANGGYPAIIHMLTADDSYLEARVSSSVADWKAYVAKGDHGYPLSANLPADIAGNNFLKKWHHIAIAFKNGQMKIYVDKYRVLTAPNCYGVQPAYLIMEGIGNQDSPVIFKNFKIADGVQIYMTGQKFTDAKIVTHGITFDIDKATIKPESMGTLNMIVKLMKGNPDVKFEVDGHTDNTGTPAHNIVLSQQRANAVKAQMIVMGIDASRLTSKGFGDTKPIADNSTLDGKANNRRVEFVKQ